MMWVAQLVGWSLAGAVSATVWFLVWLVVLLLADPTTAWADQGASVYISDASVAAILGAATTAFMWWLKRRKQQ